MGSACQRTDSVPDSSMATARIPSVQGTLSIPAATAVPPNDRHRSAWLT